MESNVLLHFINMVLIPRYLLKLFTRLYPPPGRTIVLSTHHLDEAEIIGDRIVILHQVRTIYPHRFNWADDRGGGGGGGGGVGSSESVACCIKETPYSRLCGLFMSMPMSISELPMLPVFMDSILLSLIYFTVKVNVNLQKFM